MSAVYFQNLDFLLEVEEFTNGVTGIGLGLANSSAGGSSNTNESPADGTRMGITQLSTGSAAAIDQRGGIGTSLSSYRVGGGFSTLFGFGIKPVAPLITGVLTGWYRIGLASVISSAPNDAIEFRSVDGGNYFAVTRSSSVETVTDLGIAPVDGTWQDLSFVINAAGTTVWFYRVINNAVTLVATHTTNIPSALMGFRATCHRSSSTGTAVILSLDYVVRGRGLANGRWPRP